MLGLSLGLQPQYTARQPVAFPAGFNWDAVRFPLEISKTGARYSVDAAPRDLVDPAIWSGAVFHVDGVAGDDDNSGVGLFEGDFGAAKRSIHAGFAAGNATNAPYRLLIKAGDYAESSFTRNGNEEPTQAVALIGWGGAVRYRTGPFDVVWSDAGGTYSAAATSVKRVLRTDVLTSEGQYTGLLPAADLVACAVTPDSWVAVGPRVHVNIGREPSVHDIALIRSFHGARFVSHDRDFYMEGIHTEGGITGALHFDAVATRNIVAVDCSFRYAAPSNPSAPLDAVRVRRTNGLVAFFDCDASQGAKDGWSFHEDGTAGMHVVLQSCTGWRNGTGGATSCNGFTIHDGVRAIVLNGAFGLSRNGTEVHMIQSSEAWLAGTSVVARDVDGTSVAYKCSNAATMWIEDCSADAAGSALNYALEANSGTVFTRGFRIVAGDVETSLAGSVTPF